jgi:hypothetical protein
MSRRSLILAIVIIVVLMGGMVSGVFADSIQRALALPVHTTKPPLQNTTQMGTVTTGQGAVRATAPATMSGQQPTSMLANDTFQRADQALWGTASDGQAWMGDANSVQAFSVVGNAGQIASAQNTTFNALLGPVAVNAEVTVDGSVSPFDGKTNLGVVVRWTNNKNWYKALIDGTTLRILKNVQGTQATLANASFTAQAGVPYTLRFRAVGTMLLAKAWPSGTQEPTQWLATATDTTLTSGKMGIRVVIQNGTTIKVNSFLSTTAQ